MLTKIVVDGYPYLGGRFLGLYLTNACNRHCEFCFRRHDYPQRAMISLEDVDIFFAWAERERLDFVSLAGGEPTMHPDFVACAERLKRLRLNPRLRIISNLLCDEAKLEAFRGVTILANADSLDQYSEEELQTFRRNLKVVSGRDNCVTLSYTIWRLDQPEEHLFRYCEEFGIARVRLDLARASILRRNRHVSWAQAATFKGKLLGVARRLRARGIVVQFDCPLPEGFISLAELEELRPEKYSIVDPEVHLCDAIYVNPDLTIAGCPHQRLIEQRLDTFSSFEDLMGAFFGAKAARLLHKAVDKTGPVLCEAERFLPQSTSNIVPPDPAVEPSE
jgi:MoaA/NifB/PqqE/SkfB family radical SAM enzyme